MEIKLKGSRMSDVIFTACMARHTIDLEIFFFTSGVINFIQFVKLLIETRGQISSLIGKMLCESHLIILI